MSVLESAISNANLATTMDKVKQALLMSALQSIRHTMMPDNGPEQDDARKYDRFMLDSVGPAAASAAVEFATNASLKKGKYQGVHLNGSFVNNVRIIQTQNDDDIAGAYSDWSNTLRQFLLPRYAYLDFDRIVDPRHQIDLECGYPKFITPIMYRYLYDRDDVARRVVDIYPDESWAVNPDVCEDEDEETYTPFEEFWRILCDDFNVLQFLYRLDRLSGVGHYGALLLGIDDGKNLDEPIDEPELLAGKRNSVGKNQRQLLYMRPFDEYLSFVQQFEVDVNHPRYGLPKFYNLVFLDMTIDSAGASIGTRLNRRVHWSRVLHVTDNLQASNVFGIPRQQPVFNRLLDLRKIKGGSAEMFWKAAWPGISFEIDPKFVADDPEFDKDEFRKEIEDYSNGLQRYLRLVGVSAKSLAPAIADPEKHVKVQMEAIASHGGIPIRIFLGSEEGRLASSQDKLTWNQRLGRRLKMTVEPNIIRGLINRLIAIGVMPPPKSGKYFVSWGDLNTSTDEDKANLALKWTQSISQYVASGAFHFISPIDYMTIILGLKPRDALRIDKYIKEQGGYEMLKKVDPSEGSGVNGKRTNNITKGETSGSSGSRPEKRDSADKKSEGMTS